MNAAEGLALFNNCVLYPDDEAGPLVYADWLEENGQAELARLARLPWAYSTTDDLIADTKYEKRFKWFIHRCNSSAYHQHDFVDRFFNLAAVMLDERLASRMHGSEEVRDYLFQSSSMCAEPLRELTRAEHFGLPNRFYGVQVVVAEPGVEYDRWWFLTQYQVHRRWWDRVEARR